MMRSWLFSYFMHSFVKGANGKDGADGKDGGVALSIVAIVVSILSAVFVGLCTFCDSFKNTVSSLFKKKEAKEEA